MTASEIKKAREEELLPKLQNPARAKAEEFIKTVLIQYFNNSQCIADGKKHYQSCCFFKGNDNRGFSFETIKDAVSIVEEFGIKGKISNDGGCSFYKESEDAESI